MTTGIQIYEAPGVEFDLAATSGSLSVVYRLNGINNENTASNLIKSYAPLMRYGLVRLGARGKLVGPDSWEFTVRYGDEEKPQAKEPPKPGVWEFTFTTGQATHKITQSIKVIQPYQASETNPAPDQLGAINVDDRGVNGIDVQVPDPQFTITGYYDPKIVTAELFFEFERIAFTINGAPFLGAQPGELLFLGVEGRGERPTVAGQRVKPVAITFKWAYQPTKRNFKVGAMTIKEKRGWDVLDVRYGQYADEKVLIRRPIHAYVHQVYEETDFNTFGFDESKRRGVKKA